VQVRNEVFEVTTALVGVTENAAGAGYIWTYHVCTSEDTNQPLGGWAMSICGDPNVPQWDIEPPDVDYFDLSFFEVVQTPNGPVYQYTSEHGNVYEVVFGVDPASGLYGITYEAMSGYAIEGGLCETFEFCLTAPFAIIDRWWGATDGTDVVTDLAGGPACAPVPVPGALVLGLIGLPLLAWRRIGRKSGRRNEAPAA
jgi:hypothetical protein